jgi:general secretion pathway protein G
LNKTNKIRRARRADAGFTLVELMVVIAIIATLAAIVGYNVFGAIDDSNVGAAKAQISAFKTAITAFKLENKRFPNSLDELLNNAKNKPYLEQKQIPSDPWGNPYHYTQEGAYGFKIVSYGGDGGPGGEGPNADIASDDLQ